MKMSQKFNLKWEDFQTNVSKSFRSLKAESELYDVTLVSEDEQLIQAHKIVLSASSDFFRNILRKSRNDNNTLIYLSGVESENLSLLLDYIYEGEVDVYEDNLGEFLKIAQKLKINGLIDAEYTSKSNFKEWLNKLGKKVKRFENIIKKSLDESEEENEDLRTDEDGITVDSTLNEGIHSQPKRTNIETAIMEECENIAHDENSGDNIFETFDKIVTQNAGNEIDCHAPDIVTDESVEDIPVSIEKYRRRSSRRSQERILQLDMQNKTLGDLVISQNSGWACTVCCKFSKKKVTIENHASVHLKR